MAASEWVAVVFGFSLLIAFIKVCRLEGPKANFSDESPYEECYPTDKREMPTFAGGTPVVATPRISPGEYEWQATVHTRAEIQKLVKSDEYRKFMQKRGGEVLAHNWNAQATAQGSLPMDDYDMKNKPIDLNAAFSKIDADIRKCRTLERKHESDLDLNRQGSTQTTPPAFLQVHS